jgi:hypothetical protein
LNSSSSGSVRVWTKEEVATVAVFQIERALEESIDQPAARGSEERAGGRAMREGVGGEGAPSLGSRGAASAEPWVEEVLARRVDQVDDTCRGRRETGRSRGEPTVTDLLAELGILDSLEGGE